jgi:hypothetical protein
MTGTLSIAVNVWRLRDSHAGKCEAGMETARFSKGVIILLRVLGGSAPRRCQRGTTNNSITAYNVVIPD